MGDDTTTDPWYQMSRFALVLSVPDVVSVLDNTQDERISLPCQQDLRPSLVALSAKENQDSYLALGRAWLGLSRFLLKLYVLDIPIDPAAVYQSCSQEFWVEQKELLQDELYLHRELERTTVGRRDNLAIRYLSNE